MREGDKEATPARVKTVTLYDAVSKEESSAGPRLPVAYERSVDIPVLKYSDTPYTGQHNVFAISHC